jgi:hypothetical protein
VHREVWKLRIFQDARYTDLIALCHDAIATVLPNRVGDAQKVGCKIYECLG